MRRWGLVTAVGVLACAASIAAWRLALFTGSIATELDRASALTSIAPRPQMTIVFDLHGKPTFSFFVEQRISVPLERDQF
jgi:membrane carboxypeptidase/penicillin-binding protein